MEDVDRYRCRHLYLQPGDGSVMQAEAACAALAKLDGILLSAVVNADCIHIIYSLDKLTFEMIVELLGELDFNMDSSFLISLRNTIYGFLEDNAREHMQIDITELPSIDDDSVEIPPTENEKYWDDYR